MQRPGSLFVPSRVFLRAGLLFVLAGCGGEDLPTNRRSPLDEDGGGVVAIIDGARIPDDGGEIPQVCPTDPPKLGEACGPDYTESTMCELKVNECTAPGGGGFADYSIFCCPTGFWESCGGRYPCENVPPPDAAPLPPAPDAAADLPAPIPDAGADAAAPDAGVDASPDADPDLALDTTPDSDPDVSPDTTPDSDPDVSPDTAPDA